MVSEGRLKKVSGKSPDFGAIFMSNASTMEECFDRKLFGLPASCADFVKGVKVGMILFLFEYEKRELYGVFKATSDGELNIVPDAYSSSGRSFPAQVRFTTIWQCHPLRENKFQDAIRDNYFAKIKFNLGLSKNQVQRLLRLFDSRKIRPLQLKREMEEDWSDHTQIARKKLKPLAYSSKSTVTKDELQLLDSGDSHTACEESDDMNCNSSHCPEGPSSQNSLAFVASHVSTSGQESGNDADYPIQSLPVPIGEELNELDTSGNLDNDLGDYIPLVSSDDSDSTDSRASPEDHLGLLFSTSGLYEHAFKPILAPSTIANLEGNACSLKPSIVTSQENNNSDHIHTNPSVRGLYSDASNNRNSVFSRLSFSSGVQNKEDNTEVEISMHTKGDKSAQEIMENLEQMHDKWKNKVRTSISFRRQTYDILNHKTSVFLRLSRTSEINLQDIDAPVRLVQRHNRGRNTIETKKTSVFSRLSMT